jgi:hypothetical protein
VLHFFVGRFNCIVQIVGGGSKISQEILQLLKLDSKFHKHHNNAIFYTSFVKKRRQRLKIHAFDADLGKHGSSCADNVRGE